MVKMVLSSSRDQSSSVMAKSKSTVGTYESVIESLQSFINEDNLSSMAYNNGKSYYGSVLVPFVKASILLTEAVSEACQKFVDTYCTEVDSCDLDSDRLERQISEAKMRIDHLESIRQDITLKDIPDYAKEQQLMYNDKTMEPILSMKKDLEDKLEKLLEFEATSPEIFSNITDLKAIVDKGKAQTDVSWNGGAFVIPKDLSWTNTVTDRWKSRLDEIKAKEEAYHNAKRKELEGYNVYAWPYQDPVTKEVSIMWFIDKDGVRIFDEELQEYVEKYGKDLEGIYEIVGWDKIYELDLAARRRGDGKNYLNENQLPGDFTQWFAQKGAVLDSAYWYGEKTGLLDLAMMVGLSYAATKSQMKATPQIIEDIPERPSWQQSELDAGEMFPNYSSQKSFLDGNEVSHGTKNSSRPEYFKPGHSVEVKNYKIETPGGRSNLANNVSKQVNQRITNLPGGTKQTIVVDVRGQNYTNGMLDDIVKRITEKCDVSVDIKFME